MSNGYVYLASNGVIQKIGQTTRLLPDARIREINRDATLFLTPRRELGEPQFELLHYFPCINVRHIERSLLRKYRKRRVTEIPHQEYFALQEDEIGWIRSIEYGDYETFPRANFSMPHPHYQQAERPSVRIDRSIYSDLEDVVAHMNHGVERPQDRMTLKKAVEMAVKNLIRVHDREERYW